MILKILTLTLLISSIYACLDKNCLDCNNYISTSTNGDKSIIETCYKCGAGYTLSNDKCQTDILLIIILPVICVIFIIIEIVCFIMCHKKNRERNQREPFNFKKLFNHQKKDEIVKIRHLERD